MVVIACAIVSTTLTYNSIRAIDEFASLSVMEFGDQILMQLAQRVEPAVNLKDTDGVSTILSETVNSMPNSITGGLVIDVDGGLLAETIRAGNSPRLMQDIAVLVLADGTPRNDLDSLIVARPVYLGMDRTLIGVVALEWHPDALSSGVWQKQKLALMLAGGLAALLLAASFFVLSKIVTKPMLAIAQATQKIASGDYTSEMPNFKPGSEMYPVANALTEFQQTLKTSENARNDAMMKSIALDAGSAALMIADADFKIVYASKSVLDLLKHNQSVIASHIKGFDSENIIGQSIDIFHKKPDMQRKMLGAIGASGHGANIEMDDVTLELKVSKIDGEEGNRIGYVVEWADVSEERMNAAVLESLNRNQARAEFGKDGRLIDANDAFCRLVGLQSSSQNCNFSETVFVEHQAADPAKAMFGEIRIQGKNNQVSHLLGGLSPVKFNNGKLKRTVLIAADVTEEYQRKVVAETERERLQSEQDAMISSLSDALAGLAEGDLTVRINEAFAGSNDRIRQDFNTAIERLDDAIDSVVASTSDINIEVSGVADAATDLSIRTENQAARLEETAAAVSQISASVTSSAEGARNANGVVVAAQSDAQASGKVVREAVTAMGKIQTSSSEISSIIKVIDDIAFQTNLLALNAGVEAARAGDAGRGFAVVASEVRALAQRSSEAASEIGTLISTSSENVELGVRLVGDAGEALEKIITSISNISEYVSQIAIATEEQSASVAEINSSIGQLDKVTQQNAAMFEETTAASHNLLKVASDLHKRVQRFSTQSQEKRENHSLTTFKSRTKAITQSIRTA
jgi:methyl-accepting chemotaxis protein